MPPVHCPLSGTWYTHFVLPMCGSYKILRSVGVCEMLSKSDSTLVNHRQDTNQETLDCRSRIQEILVKYQMNQEIVFETEDGVMSVIYNDLKWTLSDKLYQEDFKRTLRLDLWMDNQQINIFEIETFEHNPPVEYRYFNLDLMHLQLLHQRLFDQCTDACERLPIDAALEFVYRSLGISSVSSDPEWLKRHSETLNPDSDTSEPEREMAKYWELQSDVSSSGELWV